MCLHEERSSPAAGNSSLRPSDQSPRRAPAPSQPFTSRPAAKAVGCSECRGSLDGYRLAADTLRCSAERWWQDQLQNQVRQPGTPDQAVRIA